MPSLAKLSAAAQIGQGKHAAVFHPISRHRSEVRSHADIEAAVSSHQNACGAIELQVLSVYDKHRHACLVAALIPDLINSHFIHILVIWSCPPNRLLIVREVVPVDRGKDGKTIDTRKKRRPDPAGPKRN